MKQILERLKKAGSVLLVTHKDADGDALGSIIALKAFISIYQPEAKVYTYIDQRYRSNLHYWVEKYSLQTAFEIDPVKIDTLISLDCGVIKRIVLPEGFENRQVDISIDHHLEEEFGVLNIVDHNKASVGVILYELFQEAGVPINPDIAEGIYLSIYTDTGRFSFSNTDSYTLDIAARVAAAGKLVPYQFYSRLYDSVSFPELVEFGLLVSNAKKYCDGKVIIGKLHDGAGIDSRELIDFIRRDRDALLAVVLVDESVRIKASFRSKGDIDASQIAANFGGGGHKHAAACRINVDDMDQAEKELINYLERIL